MPIPTRLVSAFLADPRHGQIASLASLLAYGLLWLRFDISLAQVAVTLLTALAVQATGDSWKGAPKISGAKSALISGLSLCLLLRTNDLTWAVAASAIAVGSKFIIRFRGKHIFNPTNGALVALMLLTGDVWVSPGQWGAQATFAFAMASAGLLVVNRAARSDVTLAFMATYAGLLIARSLSIGEPLTIPLHRLESGAFVLFSFFMISDPKTTPNSRLGRLAFAVLVALGGYYIHFKLFRPNGFLWSLAVMSLLVPIIDWLSPGTRYHWPTGISPFARLDWRITMTSLRTQFIRSLHAISYRLSAFSFLRGARALAESRKLATESQQRLSSKRMSRRATKTAAFVLTGITGLGSASTVEAFCGFYVAKADSSLFNKASQVVLVRDGDRTVLTMSSDFRGDPREFAVVIPVPTAITRGQIHIAEQALVTHLDAYTAPRLVEYYDSDPCARYDRLRMMPLPAPASATNAQAREAGRAKSLGVTIEAQYTVGEYYIVILSATQSTGLETWLRESGYRIPAGASDVLGSYIRQNMRFFVARVNLAEQAKLGFRTLRPIQVAYESPKFMLPLRLGMVNADGPQELFVYALTRKGRVESTNYRTVKLRTDVEIPTYVKDPVEFGRMYRALFDQQVRREDMRAVFQEYAWDMSWCDPCAADPFSTDELRRLGVFWVGDDAAEPMAVARGNTSAPNVFVTRLHVRYDKAHFPEDLVFQETADRTNFQGRYVLRHAFTGPATCEAAIAYRRELADRREREAQTLASLTGWSIDEIRKRQGTAVPPQPESEVSAWWRRLWKQ